MEFGRARHRLRRALHVLLLATLLTPLTACRTWVRVDYVVEHRPMRMKGTLPAKGKTLILRSPDACTGLTAAGEVVHLVECEGWLAVFEWSLREAGFEVAPDDALRALEVSGLSTVHAAQQLGAAAVVDVRRFAIEPDTVDTRASARLQYFKSDHKGHKKEPMQLRGDERASLERLVEERDDMPGSWVDHPWYVGVLADIRVFDVASGNPIMQLYHSDVRTYGHPYYTRHFLFRGNGLYWRPMKPSNMTGEEVMHEMKKKQEDVLVSMHGANAVAPDFQEYQREYAAEVVEYLLGKPVPTAQTGGAQ